MKKSTLEISAPSIEIYLAPLSKIEFDRIAKFGVPVEEDNPDEYDEFRDYVESHSVLSTLLVPQNLSEIYVTLDGKEITLNPGNLKRLQEKSTEFLVKPGSLYYLEINYGRQFLEFEVQGVFDISKLTMEAERIEIISDYSLNIFSPYYNKNECSDSSGNGASYVESFIIDHFQMKKI